MKRMIFAFFVLLTVMGSAFAGESVAARIMGEWTKFRAQVDTIEPQGDIGGYMLYRDYTDMTLLWRTSTEPGENEVIRFFMQRPDGQVFAVTYHKSDIIMPGRVVLRRFVGTEPTGWINHTIDFESGDYIGTQGHMPELLKAEKKMMKEWGITL